MDLKDRKPIWIVLSDLYLDTELQDYNFRYIAKKIIESPYRLEEIKQINRYEVFPVLYQNLLSVAGVWDGFQEDWLVETITIRLKKRNYLQKICLKLRYRSMKWMFRASWENIETAYFQELDNPTP